MAQFDRPRASWHVWLEGEVEHVGTELLDLTEVLGVAWDDDEHDSGNGRCSECRWRSLNWDHGSKRRLHHDDEDGEAKLQDILSNLREARNNNDLRGGGDSTAARVWMLADV